MFQYPKETHLTLGSVEGWGTNLNIVRDPPKGIFTRRVDKVGDAQASTERILDSGDDRFYEGVSVYAR